MAVETSPESPLAVRTVSRMLGDWIGRLGAVWIDGQVAEYRPRPGARNHYLTLRDTDVDMSLMVVADSAIIGRLDPPLAEGQRILVHARPDFWPARGSLSMRAREIRPVGLGALLAELARLKELLAAEGLFAPERKKPLPFIPHRIGLICGRASAAMEDVLVNARERWPAIAFEIREVPVQGVQAVPAVTTALAELDAMPEVDVIILTRGGGSVEDLLPFSNEALVRAVAACRTPVVSAIGHEQDTPLVDYVADLRASTPTDAAKRVVPSLREQHDLVDGLHRRGTRVLRNLLDREHQSLQHRRQRARTLFVTRLDSAASDVTHLAARVRALSPAATLDRGYAIVTKAGGDIVRSADDVAPGDLIEVRLAHGRLAARTIERGDDAPGN
ncbi:MAG: exodeoxyribonuclease VII large subunit [Actinobacteria bacterium]|jgi:exodeoxyribonuclease VII large subunit|nr:exodeoxyribonuclease VII large subunit [Actinomycetota bacterium]